MKERRPRVLCVAANPSIDRLVEVERFEVGRIHRPDVVRPVAGGKGLNVARAAARLGADVTACALLAGHAGRWIAEELERAGVSGRHAWATGETRTCVSVLSWADRSLTEIYERGEEVGDDAWGAFLEVVGAALLARPDIVTISGSLPAGVAPNGVGRIVTAARAAGVPIVVDTYGEPLRLAVAASPDVVKVNIDEVNALVGDAGTDADSARAAAHRLCGLGASSAIVTLGSRGAVVVTEGGAELRMAGGAELRLAGEPVIGAYPVGSGDAFLAGLAVALAAGASWTDMLRLAGAAGAANALVAGAGELDPAVVQDLVGRIVVEPFRAEDDDPTGAGRA
jgi:1-phosphofructokinase family hexose kinase